MKGNFIMNSNSFWKRLESINNITNTANGDKSYRSSLSGLVDLMFKAGMKQDPAENPCNLIKIFTDAYKENPLYAVRLLFYIRDVRGGQGCKNFFRTVISYLGKTDPKLACSLCEYIPEFLCGATAFDDSALGTTLTVELRLYEADEEYNETENYFTIGKYEYTFDSVSTNNPFN